MELDLKNKVFIITGGTKGIGEAISRSISEEGGIPAFIGRTEEPGLRLAKELKDQGRDCHFIEADLTKPESLKNIVGEVLDKFGRINGLVNNAGLNDSIGLESGSPEAFASSVGNNLVHYYGMAHFCLPALKKTKGSIINISSKVALSGQGNTSGYAAAKGAQLALTREWAAELLQYQIRVNAILPAEVMTPQYKKWLENFQDPEVRLREIEQKIPLGRRMTTSKEIAELAVFLLSVRSSHTTGQFFFPDGGYLHLDRSLT